MAEFGGKDDWKLGSLRFTKEDREQNRTGEGVASDILRDPTSRVIARCLLFVPTVASNPFTHPRGIAVKPLDKLKLGCDCALELKK